MKQDHKLIGFKHVPGLDEYNRCKFCNKVIPTTRTASAKFCSRRCSYGARSGKKSHTGKENIHAEQAFHGNKHLVK